jgi:glycosyltransferase involved in cell wall biosynthesis
LLLAGPLLRWLRARDLEAARGVDRFIANSRYVADRIRRAYGQDAEVIHPPVDVDSFQPAPVGTYYLAGGRLVPYKRVDLAVEAANRAGLPLKVFGDGPERGRLQALAGPTVEFIGTVGQRRLAELVSGCRAYLFPGVEDFGILPLEVQAGGRPVVAQAAGGALETVLDGETGVLYSGEAPQALLDAIGRLNRLTISPDACRLHAHRFRRERFEDEIAAAVRSVRAR